MAQLVVYRPAPGPTGEVRLPAHPKVYLASDANIRVMLPYAPRESELGGWANKWEAIERPGRPPLVRRTANGLPTLSFTVLISRRDHQRPVEDYIAVLRRMAETPGRITIEGLSKQERGPWRLDELGVNVLLRQHGTNLITRASVELSFVAAIDAHPRIGPVSGGHKKPKPKPKPHSNAPKAGSYKIRHYTIRKGDTLRKIANRFYGIPGEWKRIAKANHITHPDHPKPGRKITIPALPRPGKKK